MAYDQEIRGQEGQAYTYDAASGRKGGLATVYDAVDPNGDELVVKVVPIRQDNTQQWYNDARLVEREIEIAQRHQSRQSNHLMPVIDHFYNDDNFVLVMPRAEASLAERIGASGPLSEEQTRQLLLDVTDGLSELLQVNVVHRDIKPANILWWCDRWVICDFGISKITSQPSATMTWQGTGTHSYWAPELFSFEAASFKTDMYVLGCTAVEALTGVKAFTGSDLKAAHANDTAELPSIDDAGVARVINMLLAKNPDSRPADYRRIHTLLAPTTTLTLAQQKLALTARLTDERRRGKDTRSREESQFRAAQDRALTELTHIWTELGELSKASDEDCITSILDTRLLLDCLDGRLDVNLLRQPSVSKSLWIGHIVVKLLDVEDSTAPLANIDCPVASDGKWRLLRLFENHALGSHRFTLPQHDGEGGGVSVLALADVYEQMWPTPGAGMHIPPFAIHENELTAEGLLDLFSDQLNKLLKGTPSP